MKQFTCLALAAAVAAHPTHVDEDPVLKKGKREWSVSDSGPGDLQYEGQDQWRCGNALKIGGGDELDGTVWHNDKAGIVMLKEYSLDHVRPAASGKTFEDLFCASYIRKYKNPNEPGSEGVCVRDYANAWESILDADREAEETWSLFKTENGYQRTASKYKDAPSPPNDFQTQWGSGAEGPNPNNWCSAYMREMICHVAFPQFAGNKTDIEAERNTVYHQGYLAPVRPVSYSECESMMDNCNRHEPKPYSGIVSWLEGVPFIDPDQSHDNTFYCAAWNRGFGLAKAGCGVGDGDAETTATWDASSSLTPIGLLAVVATVLALVQ